MITINYRVIDSLIIFNMAVCNRNSWIPEMDKGIWINDIIWFNNFNIADGNRLAKLFIINKEIWIQGGWSINKFYSIPEYSFVQIEKIYARVCC